MDSSFGPHSISLVRAFHASACRTPQKVAVVDEEGSLTYSDLMKEAAAMRSVQGLRGEPRVASIVAWVAAMIAADTNDENAPVATVKDGCERLSLTHRTLAMCALNCIVEHGAFGRERTTMALALPIDSARGLIAATISLWQGSTLRLVRPGAGRDLIVSEMCDTAWLGVGEASPLEATPGPRLRLVIYDGLPAEPQRTALIKWFGAERVSAETGSIARGAVYRHPGLEEEGQAFVGAACA